MKPLTFQKMSFFKSSMSLQQCPEWRDSHGVSFPEVAVAGRSNVGKSSLLNHLFQTKKLVKVSATPGKTQTINFFTVDERCLFADLPGYGYAEVPLSVKKQWGKVVEEYLQKRDALRVVLFLLDIRREPSDEDRRLMDWLVASQKATVAVLTKVDKVSKNEMLANTHKILKGLGVENLHYVHYSVKDIVARQRLIVTINDALADELS